MGDLNKFENRNFDCNALSFAATVKLSVHFFCLVGSYMKETDGQF